MLLIDYLNKNFITTNLWSQEVLVERFMTNFGVNVKVEGDLFLFKYDMIAANWQKDLTRECRGVIVRKGVNGWSVVSRPFDKFWNVHEGHSGIHEDKDFNAACGDFEFHEKGDGTCIQMWFDNHKGIWRVSTLGSITPVNVGDIPGLTFDQLFWNTMENNGFDQNKLTEDDKSYTFLFELCCAENRILTKYPKNKVYSLAARNSSTGEYVSFETFADRLCTSKPIVNSFVDLGITTLEQAYDWVETQSKNTDLYGEYSEGFVIYKNGTPVAKMKNRDYVDKHHAIGAGDILHTRNVVIERFFAGTLDDLMDVLVDSMKLFAERIRDWWIERSAENMVVCQELRKHDFETQKDFALYVQAHAPNQFAGFYFSNKDDIISGYIITPLLNKWIQDNWKKFEKELKSL